MIQKDWFTHVDVLCIYAMRRYGISLLRVALGVVFVWFGALKVFGVSPVVDLLQQTFTFFPQESFVFTLGLVEVAIGTCLIFKFFLRGALALLWLQMAGTFFTFFLNPPLFFNGNILLLTQTGEFIVKNLVFVVAGIVVGGYDIE